MEEKHFRDDQTFMLIRFGSKDRLESLQKGCLYMKNLQYFIDLEKTIQQAVEGKAINLKASR